MGISMYIHQCTSRCLSDTVNGNLFGIEERAICYCTIFSVVSAGSWPSGRDYLQLLFS